MIDLAFYIIGGVAFMCLGVPAMTRLFPNTDYRLKPTWANVCKVVFYLCISFSTPAVAWVWICARVLDPVTKLLGGS